MHKKMIIAIDGTAGSGKGTLAKKLAKHFNLMHLSSGKLYRYLGYKIIKNNINVNETKKIINYASKINIRQLSSKKLNTIEVGKVASIIALNSQIRETLKKIQRKFTKIPRKNYAGTVIDGRDIGTVILPNADFKFFLTANEKVRSIRRFKELRAQKIKCTKSQVLTQIRERDKRDKGREIAPLRTPKDAYLINTSFLDIETVFKIVKKYINKVNKISTIDRLN